MIPHEHIILLALFMFTCGAIGVCVRRNLLFVLMAVELMLNAVNLILVTAGRIHGNLDGQVAVLFVITVAACEAGVGMAMVIALFRKYGNITPNFWRALRG